MDFNIPKIERTHDLFYLKNKIDDNPKDSFKRVADLISNYKDINSKKLTIADIGCAAGQFPAYLTKRFENDNIIGYEYVEELVSAAKTFYPEIKFKKASVLDKSAISSSSLDVITLLGVLSIFDDIEPILSNISHWIKPNGRVYMHGMFNPFDIDVFIKYRDSKKYAENIFEPGWNIISQSSITRILEKNNVKLVKFHEFKISCDIKKNSDDPVRSWTEKLKNGERQIVNGICLKQPQFILEAGF